MDLKPQDFKFTATGIFPDPNLSKSETEIHILKTNIYSSILDKEMVALMNTNSQQMMDIIIPQTRKYWKKLLLVVGNSALEVIPIEHFLKI